jgi:hypothetical protein
MVQGEAYISCSPLDEVIQDPLAALPRHVVNNIIVNNALYLPIGSEIRKDIPWWRLTDGEMSARGRFKQLAEWGWNITTDEGDHVVELLFAWVNAGASLDLPVTAWSIAAALVRFLLCYEKARNPKALNFLRFANRQIGIADPVWRNGNEPVVITYNTPEIETKKNCCESGLSDFARTKVVCRRSAA